MKPLSVVILIIIVGAVTVFCSNYDTHSTYSFTQEQVKAITQKVADRQILEVEDLSLHRTVSGTQQENAKIRSKTHKNMSGSYNKNRHDISWTSSVLYACMYQWSEIADEPEKYKEWLKSIGKENDWKLGGRLYHAEDYAIGQVYTSLYQDCSSKKMILPTIIHFDSILANRKTGSLEWVSPAEVKAGKKETDCFNRWGWADALFMAPPVWARLARITGEKKYLEFMDEEYHATYDFLYDKSEKLFSRDASYFSLKEKNGRKIFESKGNGLVFAGLALMISDLPENWPGRQFYVSLFKDMAFRIKSLQREDGTWSKGLLGDVGDYPNVDMGGTAFFTYGLAFGINNAILERAKFEPVVFRAWEALTPCVTAEGLLDYKQVMDVATEEDYPAKDEVTDVGAFLAAGSEVYKLVKRTFHN
ncbi:glycoside hydrolase family 88 protein [Carboxylicivirga marina]|uniref:glycoside hydrolase family 88 protein n=1 Tax=Carboxylicivirga marina TaxID=2800988 RepID=UPI0025965D69|nr:glycoside hydrolase family 88 protein [uncultured Carboxylicivirga sp.]